MKHHFVQHDNSALAVLPMAQNFVPFNSLKKSFLQYLLEKSAIVYLCTGQKIFGRGDEDERNLYLLSGKVKLVFSSGYEETRGAQDNLFPIAHETPRACDCIAETDCSILTVDSELLDQILSWSQIAQYLLTELSSERNFDEDIDWIRTVVDSNLFFKVPPVNAQGILTRMQPLEVLSGDVIIRQEEVGNCCYFIKEGCAEVYQRDENGLQLHLADIGVGRCFGEDALVYETVRNASVRMTSDGVLMRLEKDDFKLLLHEPPVKEVSEQDCTSLLTTPVFIDVRTQEEYDEGHLALAANIPLNILPLKKRQLRADIPYVFYCDTGRRSRACAYLMAQQGINAMALRGGVTGAGMQYQFVNDAAYVLKDGRIVLSG